MYTKKDYEVIQAVETDIMNDWGAYLVEDLIVSWAEERNLIAGSTPQAQVVKLVEEFGELARGICKGDDALIKDSIGDMFVVLTIIAAQLSVDVEGCAILAYNEIRDRKGEMRDGVFVKEKDL